MPLLSVRMHLDGAAWAVRGSNFDTVMMTIGAWADARGRQASRARADAISSASGRRRKSAGGREPVQSPAQESESHRQAGYRAFKRPRTASASDAPRAEAHRNSAHAAASVSGLNANSLAKRHKVRVPGPLAMS